MHTNQRAGGVFGMVWGLSVGLGLASCAAPPEIAGHAQHTPFQHNAAKVFYLGEPAGAANPGRRAPHEIDGELSWPRYRRLLSDAELADRVRAERGAVAELERVRWDRPEPRLGDLIRLRKDASALADFGIEPRDLDRVVAFARAMDTPDPTLEQIRAAYERELVRHGDPLGVIVSGARLPASLGGRRDIAVLLRAHSSNDPESADLVVAYQRDYQPGTMLNFADLLVYFDPVWDASNPVEFRLRVVDVRAERNTRVRALLDRAQSVIASVSGLVPHPVIPGVDVAIEAARQVLANRDNEILLDYLVQFHALATFEGANRADLGLLRRGSWMVVGRRAGGTDARWAEPVYRDRTTDELIFGPLRPELVYDGVRADAPFFEVIITTSDVQVPRSVMDRSRQLLGLIATTGKDDPDALVSAVDTLASSVRGYATERRLKKHRTPADLGAVVDTLWRTQEGKSEAGGLALDQRRALERTIRQTLGEEEYRSATTHFRPPAGVAEDPVAESLYEWWRARGSRGAIVSDSASPLGFRWTPSVEP